MRMREDGSEALMVYTLSGIAQISTRPPDRIVSEVIASMRRSGEIWSLAGLCVVYFLVYALEAAQLYRPANLVGPTFLFIVLMWSCYHSFRVNPISLWAPLTWFKLACAVYFGFGALVPYLSNEITLLGMQSVFTFGDADIFKVNIVSSFSIFLTLSICRILLNSKMQVSRSAVHRPVQVDSRKRTLVFALVFLFVGGSIRYGVAVPYALGFLDATVPGFALKLSAMYYVGIYLLISYAIGHSKGLLFLISVLILTDVFVSVALFSKTSLLLILIFSFMGLLSASMSRARIVVGALSVLIAYFLFQPLVHYGRSEVSQSYGGRANLQERLEIAEYYFANGADATDSERQGGMSRLSYVNANAFVISQYDSGLPGSTLGDAAAVFVPRLLWPEKPNITRLGPELYLLVRGRTGSAMGIGPFAEAYWNFGWIGIPPFMVALAFILSVFTKVSLSIMARRDWLMLPIVFMGVDVGLRVDGHFVPDILGAAWIALVSGAALALGRVMILTLAFPGKRQLR